MRLTGWQARVIQLLAVPGMIVAFYLLLFHAGSLAGGACTSSGWDDCGLVSGPGAPYASVGPIPVALIGFIGYVVIFLLVWLKDFLPIVEDYLAELLVAVTGSALLFTLYLTALEMFLIHAFCRYCLISAGIVLLMFILSLSYLRSVNGASDLHLAEAR